MFDLYRNRLSHKGDGERHAIKQQSVLAREILFNNTQSYKEVIIDGQPYDAKVISDVGDTVKTGDGNYVIEFRDGITFYPGTYVKIKNIFGEYDYWLIIDIIEDFRPQFLIKKCVYLLKWRNAKGRIVCRWITFDDSYKIYDSIRNYGYKTNLPESSLVVRLPLDEETINIRLDKRFLMDVDGLEEVPDVYKVTNRSILSKHYKGRGIIELALSKCQFNHQTDSTEFMVADFYTDSKNTQFANKINAARAEISCSGKKQIVMGTPYKQFKLTFYDEANKEVEADSVWKVLILPEFQEYFDYVVDENILKIKTAYNENLQSYKVKLIGSNLDGSISTEMYVKVVSGI